MEVWPRFHVLSAVVQTPSVPVPTVSRRPPVTFEGPEGPVGRVLADGGETRGLRETRSTPVLVGLLLLKGLLRVLHESLG